MKSSFVKKLLSGVAGILLLASQSTNAQIIETDFFKAGVNDGMKLLEAYITPYANAFGAGYNSAWYNTAKPHKFGGFDLTLTVSAGFVPDAATEFDLADLNFTNLELVNPTNSIAPTVAGSTDAGPELHMLQTIPGYGEVEMFNADSPGGLDWGIVPAPMLQAGIGLPLGSEIKIRYIPNTPIGESSVQLLGGGLVHSISQYIKGMSLLPLNISAFGGYSKLAGSVPISIQPESFLNYTSYTSADFQDQAFNFSLTTWNLSLLGSVDVPFVTGFLGIGYSKTSTVLELEGFIPLPTVDPFISTSGPVYVDSGVVEEVESINIENSSGLRFNVGGRLKLGVITFHADYTYSNYNVVTGGIGISFR